MSESSAPPILPEQAIILGDIAKGAQSYLATLGRDASTRHSTAHLTPGDRNIDAPEAEVSQSCQLADGISQPSISEESNILSGQVWANLLKMSLPIGTSSNDEDILVDTLCKSSKRRQTYKEALDSLHGINDHFASTWKDYYLDHKERIDRRIVDTQKKKRLLTAHFKRDAHPGYYDNHRTTSGKDLMSGPDCALSFPDCAPPLHGRDIAREHQCTTTPMKGPSSGPKRKPKPSSGDDSVSVIHHPEPSRARLSLKIGTPPSRSPTPPKTIVDMGNGNQYTKEDKGYFVKFVQWRSRYDRAITMHDLAEQLSNRAPHHSYWSWRSYMKEHRDVVEYLRHHARVSTSRSYPESSALDARGGGYTSGCEDDQSEDEERSKTDLTDDALTDEDERNMGGEGDRYSSVELRLMARYIASIPGWLDLPNLNEQLRAFQAKYPQRTFSAWSHFYSRRQQEILHLSEKYRHRRSAKGAKSQHRSAEHQQSLITTSSQTSLSSRRSITHRTKRRISFTIELTDSEELSGHKKSRKLA